MEALVCVLWLFEHKTMIRNTFMWHLWYASNRDEGIIKWAAELENRLCKEYKLAPNPFCTDLDMDSHNMACAIDFIRKELDINYPSWGPYKPYQ